MPTFDVTVHGIGSLGDGKATSWQVWVTEHDSDGKTILGQVQIPAEAAANVAAQIQARLSSVQTNSAVNSAVNAAGTANTIADYLNKGPAATPDAEIAATQSLLETAASGAVSEGAQGLGEAALDALVGIF